jgi:hypothetical protein
MSSLDPIFDGLNLALLAVYADSALRFANRAPTERRRTLYAATAFIALGLAFELIVTLLTYGSEVGVLMGPAVAAIVFWSLGRATLWIGACRWLGRGWRVVVPLFAMIGLLMFATINASPYLESGSRARELLIETTSAREWLALGCLVVCDLAIAWIADAAIEAGRI